MNSTKIFDCIRNNEIDYLKTCLSDHVNLNFPDDTGVTPLHIAAANDKFEIVKLLIKHYPVSINNQTNFGETALHQAVVKTNNFEMVKFMLSHSANPNLRNNYGMTPIFYAAMAYDKKAIIDLLIEYGADQENRDINKQTYLSLLKK